MNGNSAAESFLRENLVEPRNEAAPIERSWRLVGHDGTTSEIESAPPARRVKSPRAVQPGARAQLNPLEFHPAPRVSLEGIAASSEETEMGEIEAERPIATKIPEEKEVDRDLAQLVKCWHTLRPAAREAILAVARAMT